MLNVLVPLKRVPDPYVKVKPLPDGSGLDTSNTKFEINPFDEIALEAAIRLREAGNEVAITVISIGSQACEEQLRKGLAMGADHAILAETDLTLTPLDVAKILKTFVQERQFQLVLMGKQATDDDANQTGQMLSAILGWPIATCASKISLSANSVTVDRESDAGEQTLSLQLPCVITSDLRLAEPRYIALPGIIKARSKPMDKVPVSHGSSSKYAVNKLSPVPPRKQGVKVKSIDELVAAIQASGALSQS